MNTLQEITMTFIKQIVSRFKGDNDDPGNKTRRPFLTPESFNRLDGRGRKSEVPTRCPKR